MTTKRKYHRSVIVHMHHICPFKLMANRLYSKRIELTEKQSQKPNKDANTKTTLGILMSPRMKNKIKKKSDYISMQVCLFALLTCHLKLNGQKRPNI